MSFSSMAFTFVSKPSRSRVSRCVHRLEPPRLYPGVGLRRANRRMTEQLLNSPQISAPFEEVGCEGVAQGVRRDPALERRATPPGGQATPHIGRRKPPSALREKECGLGVLLQRRPGALEVARQGAPRRLPRRDDARLRALALHAHV